MKKGFTLIELLVVIAIIALLASVVSQALMNARVNARDAKIRMDLEQIANANELMYLDVGSYPESAGYLFNWDLSNNALAPKYIPKLNNDTAIHGGYQYWRKDARALIYPCLNLDDPMRFGVYAILENPTAQDLATIEDSFDECVRDTWGYNYKVGN